MDKLAVSSSQLALEAELCLDTKNLGDLRMSEKMLYERLGGYDGTAMFATTLVGQAQKDELLERFWANRGEDRIAQELQLLIDYLVRETGGQMYYTGRDMALAHQGMGITETDWDRFIEIVVGVAGELGVGPTEGGEVMAFLNSLKADIVEEVTSL